MTPATTFDLPCADLFMALSRLSFCVSEGDERPPIRGMFLEAADTPQNIRLVATDGHRLGYAEVQVQGELPLLPANGTTHGILVPPQAVRTLIQMLPSLSATTATVSVEPNFFKVKCGNVGVEAEPVAETFPDYRARVLVGRGELAEITVDANEFAGAIDDATAYESCHIKLRILRNQIVVLAPDGAASLACVTPKDWKRFEIGFNSEYLKNVLDRLDYTFVTIGLDPASVGQPVSFEATTIPGLLYFVMPLRR
jgi:DNA polymerase III sliding clamp (beta) subunit (PCNA family)